MSREDRLREIEERVTAIDSGDLPATDFEHELAADLAFLLSELACVTEEAQTMREALEEIGGNEWPGGPERIAWAALAASSVPTEETTR